jgi:hypothetical protein
MGRDPSDDRRLMLGLTPFVTLVAVAVVVGLILYEWTRRTRPPRVVEPPRAVDVPRVVEVSLVADPADYVGPCPTVFRFHGTIRAEGRGRVTYRFQRSDHPTTPINEVDVGSAAVARVETEWHLGRQSERPFEGWQTLEVLTPQPLTSERATFRMTCVP